MDNTVEVLLGGFPGKADIAFLGWSTVALIRFHHVNMLFDTGAHGARPVLIEKLSGFGLSTNDITHVFLSHLHFDHCANITLFPKATFFVSETEWNYANSAHDIFVSETHLPFLDSYKKTFVLDNQELFPGIRCIYTPGHTPGGISLLVESRAGTIGLAGDAVKNRAELELGSVAMSKDVESSKQSINRLKDRADIIIPGHDCPLRICGNAVKPMQTCKVNIFLPDGLSGINGQIYSLEIKN